MFALIRRGLPLLLLFSATAAAAQTDQSVLQKFAIHGYINQAFADSDEYPIYGIPTDGTADLRDIALQFQFDATDRDGLLVQLRHQAFGESQRDSDDLELAWAFYERDFTPSFAAKAGRVPLPLGIFNEADGAATTSPFYRPPAEFYERAYTSRTVDGVLASFSAGSPDGWSIDADGYGGRWALDERDGGDVDATNAWGGQLWVNTPVQGVRFGGGAYRCDVEAEGRPVDYVMVHGSIDADLDRWRLAAEYLRGNLDDYGRYQAWYGQAGFQATPWFSIHARASVAEQRGANGHDMSARLSQDLGISLNFALNPYLLLKLEGHRNEGLLREDQPFNPYGTPEETQYLIASIVASF